MPGANGRKASLQKSFRKPTLPLRRAVFREKVDKKNIAAANLSPIKTYCDALATIPKVLPNAAQEQVSQINRLRY
ncbi:MAG: hypothetical protein ACI915_004663 [Gammaproteobacteria bacterium]